jgi:hypothetical protein
LTKFYSCKKWVLHTNKIMVEMMKKLKKETPVLLCKMEKNSS